MSGQTVTVYTSDHGPVTLPEPSWCLGQHSWETYQEDIEHQGPETLALIPTLCHGEVPALAVSLMQRPFSPRESAVVATLHLDGDWHELDSKGLDVAAALLVEHATALRHLARKLAALEVPR
ncbi:hypothetical protein PV371_12615 [Streptomyces sp. TX20-6-3]|uniref:DUF6907 domain-containing protein n=1 Tax=Streptomyces sp. TX20-6-3 TaxID=3028705 RepID=UPI0029BA2A64|nr:hypothetical protein [Streptomyces sp. TX20-6-3]MDX2560485.1 hypothetical protein [Streptomyces sp. TX20-6-3]